MEDIPGGPGGAAHQPGSVREHMHGHLRLLRRGLLQLLHAAATLPPLQVSHPSLSLHHTLSRLLLFPLIFVFFWFFPPGITRVGQWIVSGF